MIYVWGLFVCAVAKAFGWHDVYFAARHTWRSGGFGFWNLYQAWKAK